MMRFIFIGLVFWICGTGSSLLRAERVPPSLVKQVDALLAGDRDAVPLPLQDRERFLQHLAERIQPARPDIALLLQQLGAEEYRLREQATEKLIQLGKDIHPQVNAHRESLAKDPEVVYRCDRILSAPEQNLPPVQDLPVILFLLELDNPTLEELLPFAENYKRVFESKPREIFDLTANTPAPPQLLTFLRQWVGLPGGQEAILAWITKKLPTHLLPEAARILLEHDFKGTFPQLISMGKRSALLIPLLEKDFSDQLDDSQRAELITMIAKITRSRSLRNQLIEQVDGPKSAWSALKLTENHALTAQQYDLLFKHLGRMPDEQLLEYVRKNPQALHFISELVLRRSDLQDALRPIVLEQLQTTDSVLILNQFHEIAREHLGVEFKEGQMDEIWERILEGTKGRPGPLYMRVDALKISRSLVLKSLLKYEDQWDNPQHGSFLFTPLLWLLEAPEADIRKETLDWVIRNCLDKEYPSVSRSQMSKVRAAILKAFPDDSGDMAGKQILAFFHLRSGNVKKELSSMIRYPRFAGHQKALVDFFKAHEAAILAQIGDESMGLLSFDILYMLIIDGSFNPEHTEFFEHHFRRMLPALRQDPERLVAAVLITWMLDLDDPIGDATLLDALILPLEKGDPLDLLNLLDERHARILPELLRRAEQTDAVGLRTFQAALMIAPEHPELRKRTEHILAGEASEEEVSALFDVLFRLSREPRLSEMPPHLLSLWFATDTAEAFTRTLERLAFFRDADNRRVLLRTLRPALPVILASDKNLTSFRMLYKHPFLDREEDMGVLTGYLRSDKGNVIKNAAETLCHMDTLPEDFADGLLDCLQRENDASARYTLLWAMALTGRRMPDAVARIEEQRADFDSFQYVVAFCLAQIHPSPEERERNLRRIMAKFMDDPEWWNIKQIRLTREQPEIIRPFLLDVLHRALFSDAEEDQKYHFGHVDQILWWIPKGLPEDEGVALLKSLLEAVSDQNRFHRFRPQMTDVMFSVLEIHFPEHIADFVDVLKKLPFPHQITPAYRRLIERIPQDP